MWYGVWCGVVYVMCELQPFCHLAVPIAAMNLLGKSRWSLHMQGTEGAQPGAAHAGGAGPAVLTGLH